MPKRIAARAARGVPYSDSTSAVRKQQAAERLKGIRNDMGRAPWDASSRSRQEAALVQRAAQQPAVTPQMRERGRGEDHQPAPQREVPRQDERQVEQEGRRRVVLDHGEVTVL